MPTTRTIAAAGVGALALALLGSPASAQTFVNGSAVTYATEAVGGSGGALTIPAGPTYTSQSTTGATAGSFLITFTLPTGVTFTNTPTVKISSSDAFLCAAQSALAPTGGGNGSGFATFTVSTQADATSATCTVQLNAIVVAGANSLTKPTTSTATTGFIIAEQVSGSSGTAVSLNQAKTLTAPLASSGEQLAYSTNIGKMAGEALAIDIGPTGLGAKFLPAGAGTAPCGGVNFTDQACADIGAVQPGANNFLNASATDVFRFSTTSASIAISGNFSGIATAVLSAPSNALGGQSPCLATAAAATAQAGAITGTIDATKTKLTFSGINGTSNGGAATNPWSSTTGVGYGPTFLNQEVCLYASGPPTVIGANKGGFTSQASIDAGLGTAGNSPDLLNALVPYFYNGAIQNLLYIPNTTGSYPSFLRVVNNGSTPATVIALVQSETGSTGNTVVASSMAANSNLLVPMATIVTNSGVTLDATKRVSMQILSPIGVNETMFLVNPDGTVTQGGSGCAGSTFPFGTGGPC